MSTEFVVAVPHPNPIVSWHLAVAPRRHVAAFYDLDVQEQRMIWHALGQLREHIAASISVEGFYVGFADGAAGDAPDFHTYVHLLPRIAGQRLALPSQAEWVDLGSQP